MKRFITLTLLAISLTATSTLVAQPRPGGSSTRIKSSTFRDRAPRPHVFNVAPHH